VLYYKVVRDEIVNVVLKHLSWDTNAVWPERRWLSSCWRRIPVVLLSPPLFIRKPLSGGRVRRCRGLGGGGSARGGGGGRGRCGGSICCSCSPTPRRAAASQPAVPRPGPVRHEGEPPGAPPLQAGQKHGLVLCFSGVLYGEA